MIELGPIHARKAVQALFGKAFLPVTAHPGLVFDRYFPCWDKHYKRFSNSAKSSRDGGRDAAPPPTDPLIGFVRDYNRLAEFQEWTGLLDDVHRRLDNLVEWRGGRRWVFRLQDRLATGLGADHPLDNGFVFDRSVGVPYLSGSSVKGLCRAWANLAQRDFSAKLEPLFGTGPETGADDQSGRQGEVVFLAAYPDGWPELEIDIINAHHPKYYGAPDSQRVAHGRYAPLDIEDPVPVNFLTVKAGTRFVFRVLNGGQTSDRVDRVRPLLESALADFGIGAKTALGYGVMQPDAPAAKDPISKR